MSATRRVSLLLAQHGFGQIVCRHCSFAPRSRRSWNETCPRLIFLRAEGSGPKKRKDCRAFSDRRRPDDGTRATWRDCGQAQCLTANVIERSLDVGSSTGYEKPGLSKRMRAPRGAHQEQSLSTLPNSGTLDREMLDLRRRNQNRRRHWCASGQAKAHPRNQPAGGGLGG